MSRWWRAYDEAVDDPKLILLTDRQHRTWFNLCCIASQNGGGLPQLTVIAVKLREKPDRAKHMVAELVALGLVDHDGGKFEMHNWGKRQFKSDGSTERVKRFRNEKRNVPCNVSSPLHETEMKQDQSQNTEAERKRDMCIAGARGSISPEAHAISDDCYRALGIEIEAIPPEWFGLVYQIDMMLRRGYDPPNIVATFAKLGGQKPLKPMNYFIKAVESSQQNQIKPAQAPNAKSGNVVQAADRLIAKLAYFDQPAPDEARICSGEGENSIRAIPSR